LFLVDTNVLILAVNQATVEHAHCRALVERWTAESLPWFTTWPILYEFMRVTTHPKVFPSPLPVSDAWGFIDRLLDSSALAVLAATPRHREVARRTLAEHPGLAGNVLHDTHTAILMREHGIRQIYTRDADFRQFPFLEVLDPLAA
jgi:uncharacterized protein